MIPRSFGLLATFLPFVPGIAATVPVCTSAQWAFNSLNQSPCEMAGKLLDVCNINGDLVPLTDGQSYSAGSPVYATACSCNTVMYSLLSACGRCQLNTGGFGRWSWYSTNCSLAITFWASFPGSIPSSTRIPHWAYLDVTTLDIFSVTAAQDSLNAPESTFSGNPTPTFSPTGTTHPANPTHSPNSPTLSDGHPKKSKAGAIAGGVVGGLAFLALVAGSTFWLRRRQKPSVPLAADTGSSVTTAPQTTQYAESVTPVGSHPAPSPPLQKPYDPSDPLTFPGAVPTLHSAPPANPDSAGVITSQAVNQHPPTQPGHGYSGAPEV